MCRVLLCLRFAPVVLCAVLLSRISALAGTLPESARTQAAADAQAVSLTQLEALSGEYTDTDDPDTPLSFYVQDGKLFVESERNVPEEFKTISALEFGFPELAARPFASRLTLQVMASAWLSRRDLSDVYHRTGPPVHHVFHDYERRRSDDPHA